MRNFMNKIESINDRNILVDIMSADGVFLGNMSVAPERRYFDGVHQGKKVVCVNKLRTAVIVLHPSLRNKNINLFQRGSYYCFKYE